jgi:hypothetical protein
MLTQKELRGHRAACLYLEALLAVGFDYEQAVDEALAVYYGYVYDLPPLVALWLARLREGGGAAREKELT